MLIAYSTPAAPASPQGSMNNCIACGASVVPIVSDEERLHLMRCTACLMEYATVDVVLMMYRIGGFNIIPEGCLLVLGRVPG